MKMDYQASSPNQLYRSHDSVLFGVCGGIAEYFNLPPWGVRFLYIFLSFIFLPFMVILYIVLTITLKKRPTRPYRSGEEAAFWSQYGESRPEAMRRLQQRFQTLDKRLQRIESIVTRPGFGLEDEYKNL